MVHGVTRTCVARMRAPPSTWGGLHSHFNFEELMMVARGECEGIYSSEAEYEVHTIWRLNSFCTVSFTHTLRKR